MPQDFDAQNPDEDELSFIAAGKTYRMRLVGPEILAQYEDETDPDTAAEAVVRLVARIREFLLEDDRKAWDAAVKAGTIPYRTLNAVALWAWGVQTGRPTSPESPSDDGRGDSGATSSAAAAASARAAVRSRPRGRR